jgi:integrase
MPKKEVSIPKYCLHKPKGRAYMRVQGKVIYLGAYGSPESQAEYSRILAELAANPVKAPSPTAEIGMTVVELCAAYWDFAQGYYQKNGQPTRQLAHIKTALHEVKVLYAETAAADFGPRSLKAVRQVLIGKGQSRGYINKQIDIIRRTFKWAVSEELIPPSTYHGLATVAGLRKGRTEARESTPVMPVVPAVVEVTLPYLPATVAAMVRLQRFTGMRPGEVAQLRPMDLNRDGEVWEYRPASHKTEHHGKERIVYIGPQAQTVLQPYLLRPADAYCFQPAESEDKRHAEQRSRRRTKIQPSQRNRRKATRRRAPRLSYTKDSYRQAIVRAVDKANKAILDDAEKMGIDNPVLVPHWHPNQLRHTAATEIRRQFGLEAAQVILGHAKADVTQIYAERDSARAIEVVKQIG